MMPLNKFQVTLILCDKKLKNLFIASYILHGAYDCSPHNFFLELLRMSTKLCSLNTLYIVKIYKESIPKRARLYNKAYLRLI